MYNPYLPVSRLPSDPPEPPAEPKKGDRKSVG